MSKNINVTLIETVINIEIISSPVHAAAISQTLYRDLWKIPGIAPGLVNFDSRQAFISKEMPSDSATTRMLTQCLEPAESLTSVIDEVLTPLRQRIKNAQDALLQDLKKIEVESQKLAHLMEAADSNDGRGDFVRAQTLKVSNVISSVIGELEKL